MPILRSASAAGPPSRSHSQTVSFSSRSANSVCVGPRVPPAPPPRGRGGRAVARPGTNGVRAGLRPRCPAPAARAGRPRGRGRRALGQIREGRALRGGSLGQVREELQGQQALLSQVDGQGRQGREGLQPPERQGRGQRGRGGTRSFNSNYG